MTPLNTPKSKQEVLGRANHLLSFRSLKLLLALASTIILGFEHRRGPLPRFSFQEFMRFLIGSPFQVEEGSDSASVEYLT